MSVEVPLPAPPPELPSPPVVPEVPSPPSGLRGFALCSAAQHGMTAGFIRCKRL